MDHLEQQLLVLAKAVGPLVRPPSEEACSRAQLAPAPLMASVGIQRCAVARVPPIGLRHIDRDGLVADQESTHGTDLLETGCGLGKTGWTWDGRGCAADG